MRLIAAMVAAASSLVAVLASCAPTPTIGWPPEYTSPAPTATAFAPAAAPALPSLNRAPRECPQEIPVDQTACGASIHCEYGSNADPHCNTVAVCDTYGEWTVTPPYAPCANQCPAEFSAITKDGGCAQVGAVCTYYEATCGCVGSSADGGVTGKWTCIEPAAGCPARRPSVRAPCVVPMTCDYGSCTFDRPLAFTCDAMVGGAHTRWRLPRSRSLNRRELLRPLQGDENPIARP